MINVKDFGAKGDGVTDDGLAIEGAIKFVSKEGGIIYFPPGKYYREDEGSATEELARKKFGPDYI